MLVKPNLTEKSLNLAKRGQYSFWIDPKLTKNLVKKIISRIYNVHVTGVKTAVYKTIKKRNFRGRLVVVPQRKKAVVALKKDEKIEAFEVKKGKNK